MPFTCMPSTIASAILKVHMRNQAPFVDMVYDGTILPNRETNRHLRFPGQTEPRKERPQSLT